jgi:hypothetical protein
MKKIFDLEANKKSYALLVLWVVAGSALGVFVYKKWNRDRDEVKLAPMSGARICGEQRVVTDQEVQQDAKRWLVNTSDMQIEVQKALLRNIKALPETVTRILDEVGMRFTLESGKDPYTCAPKNRVASAPGPSCVKGSIKDGYFTVISAPLLEAPDGTPAKVTAIRQLEPTILPIGFWLLFQGMGRSETSAAFRDDEISHSSRLSTLKKYVMDAFKFSRGEEDFYYRAFGPSGVQSPAFYTRSVILTASNLYCNKESFDRLSSLQPEATSRFWTVYGCALGKPWFMPADEFTKLCPNLAFKK